MADDRVLLVGHLGQPCPVYVEHAGAERTAPLQEQMIEREGGIVVKDPKQAAVVVVIKRGAESVEKRIRDTCSYRRTNPWTQGVVDGMWVAHCIHLSKLLGPPDWGGHLYRPELDLEPIITEDEADAATFSVFDRPIYEPEHEEDTEELDPMQLDPVPVAGGSGSNPQNNTSEELPRDGPSSPARDTVPVPPSDGGTTQGRRMRSSKNKGSQKPNNGFQEAWRKVEKIVEDPKKKGWFGTFSTGSVLNLIDELCSSGASTDSEPDLSWWGTFIEKHAAEGRMRRTVNSWRGLYSERKGVINKCVNMLLSARTVPGSDSLKPLQDHSGLKTSWYGSRSHSGRGTLNQTSAGSDGQTIRAETSQDCSVGERPPIPSTAEPAVQPRKRGRLPQMAANNQEGRLPQTLQQAQKTGTEGLSQRPRIRPTSETQVLKQLSNRNEDYTEADYDEVADYIGEKIQKMNLPEREVVGVMTQDSVWKAFVAVVSI